MTIVFQTKGSNVNVNLVMLMVHVQTICKHITIVLSSPMKHEESTFIYKTMFSCFGNDPTILIL
jgi:hypothetical protein